MTELPKLMLKALRRDYAYELDLGVQSVEMEGGNIRTRKLRPISYKVRPSFSLSQAQARYLFAFLEVYRGHKFLAYLLIDDVEHHWYECELPAQTLSLRPIGDQRWHVSLQIAPNPRRVNADAERGLIHLYEQTSGDIQAYTNLLEELVNEKLPESMVNIDA